MIQSYEKKCSMILCVWGTLVVKFLETEGRMVVNKSKWNLVFGVLVNEKSFSFARWNKPWAPLESNVKIILSWHLKTITMITLSVETKKGNLKVNIPLSSLYSSLK